MEFYRISFDLVHEIFANKSKNHESDLNGLDDNELLDIITMRALEHHFNFTKSYYNKHKVKNIGRNTPYRKECYDIKICIADQLESLKINKNELYFSELMTKICFKNSNNNNEVLNLMGNEDSVVSALYSDISKINKSLKIQKNQLSKIKKLILSKRKYMDIFSLEPHYEFYHDYKDYFQNLKSKHWHRGIVDKVDVIKDEIKQWDIFLPPRNEI